MLYNVQAVLDEVEPTRLAKGVWAARPTVFATAPCGSAVLDVVHLTPCKKTPRI